VKIKITGIINQGSIIQVFAYNEKDEFRCINFDHRMFQRMWDCLTLQQRRGKEFIRVN